MDALVWAFTELMIGSGIMEDLDEDLAFAIHDYRGR
jgi:hypothetical protein